MPVTIEPMTCSSDGHLDSIRVVEFPFSVRWSTTAGLPVSLTEEGSLSTAYISHLNSTVVDQSYTIQLEVHTYNVRSRSLNSIIR